MLLGAAAILILGSVTAVTQHAAQRRVHGEQILAMTTCRNVLEQLRSLPVTELPALHGTGFDVPGPDGQPGGLLCVPGDSDGLPGTIEVTVNRSSGSVVLYHVRALVRWQGTTRNGTFAMDTLMGERR